MELAAQMRTASSDLRGKIASALREIETQLNREPEKFGESRARGMRVAFFGPLVLWFSVNVRVERVFVLKLRLPPRLAS